VSPCPECGGEWPSKLRAEECADQDRSDAEDRAAGAFYRSVN
jgi:hypothetical protein